MGDRFLHVANGLSVTGTLEAAGVPGQMSIWGDVLYEGPVPAGLSDDELMEVRRQFLAGDSPPVDPRIDLRVWRSALAAHHTYDELVLWYEHDMFDQLNLIQLLPRIRALVPREKLVSMICIGSFPGRPNFKGLGELSPDELASLLPTRRPVTDAQYALAERAWTAFRAPTPEPLDHFRRTDTSALPFLAPALERFLQEYPWTRDGLSRTERHLLQLAEQAPMTFATAFPRMQDGERFYCVTDGTLDSLASELCRVSPPLLAVVDRTWQLTDAGREVLAGRRDRVACGLDRWLGGVHLQTENGTPWRWDDNASGMRVLLKP